MPCRGQAGRGPRAAYDPFCPMRPYRECLAHPRPLQGVAPWAKQLSPPSSACRLQRWPQKEVVVAGGRDMGAAPPCRVSVSYLPESHPSQPGAPTPARNSETPGRAGQAPLIFYHWREVLCPCFRALPLVAHPEHMVSEPKAPLWGRTRLPKSPCLYASALFLWRPKRPPATPGYNKPGCL